MRALTIRQPWATLIAVGAKRIETRSWWTPYQGPLAIHAAKSFPGDARQLCYRDPFLAALEQARVGPATMMGQAGKVIATAELVDVVPCNASPPPSHSAEYEQAFGHYGPGRFAWLLANVRPLREPVPAKGKLGLWEWIQP